MNPLFGIDGLTITPGRAERPSVRDCSFVLAPGDSLAIVGPSGCGKSTLARALVGLESRLSGSLRYRGEQLVDANARVWVRLRREVALCWQDAASALDPRLTVRASLNEARDLSGHPPLSDTRLAEVFGRLGLSIDIARRRPHQLSGGQRQRAALARALVVVPLVLIADEVTSALDRPLALEVVEILRTVLDAETSLLFITHDLSLLPGLVDEAIVLDHGATIERGPPERLLAAPRHALTRALVEAIPRLPSRAPQ